MEQNIEFNTSDQMMPGYFSKSEYTAHSCEGFQEVILLGPSDPERDRQILEEDRERWQGKVVDHPDFSVEEYLNQPMELLRLNGIEVELDGDNQSIVIHGL